MASHRRRSKKKLLGYAARGNSTRSDQLGAPAKPRGKPHASSRTRGISNGQAAELARLQRTFGDPYTGRGMTRLRGRERHCIGANTVWPNETAAAMVTLFIDDCSRAIMGCAISLQPRRAR